jgi:hypothetical protein
VLERRKDRVGVYEEFVELFWRKRAERLSTSEGGASAKERHGPNAHTMRPHCAFSRRPPKRSMHAGQQPPAAGRCALSLPRCPSAQYAYLSCPLHFTTHCTTHCTTLCTLSPDTLSTSFLLTPLGGQMRGPARAGGVALR